MEGFVDADVASEGCEVAPWRCSTHCVRSNVRPLLWDLVIHCGMLMYIEVYWMWFAAVGCGSSDEVRLFIVRYLNPTI